MSKSPFPGMDPYLERHWLDVHAKLVTYAADALNQALPPSMAARIEERVAIESDSDKPHQFVPDVRVLEAVEQDVSPEPGGGGAVVAAPYRLVAMVEPITERYLEVIDLDAQRLITVIEFVSPSNKQSGLQAFIGKRSELLASGVHFVEIDLVRAGDWQGLLNPHVCPKEARSLYRATIRLTNEPRAVYFYPIPLRGRLPKIPVPLRPGDPKVELDLQSLVEQAYRNGRYRLTLDYERPLDQPLTGEDADWADQLLRGKPNS